MTEAAAAAIFVRALLCCGVVMAKRNVGKCLLQIGCLVEARESQIKLTSARAQLLLCLSCVTDSLLGSLVSLLVIVKDTM